MKNHLTIASVGLSLLLVSCGKKETTTTADPGTSAADGAYILASGDLLPPPGKTRSISQTTEMKDAKVSISIGDNQMEGAINQETESIQTKEPISADKLRHVIVSETDAGTIVMQGQEQPTPQKDNSLVGIPVIVELKEGKLTASLEEGTPTEEQQTALDKILKNYESHEDFVMYGDTPRKPGDTWEVDTSKLTNFAGATELSGTFTVEFKAVEEIDGVNCALLACVFDLTGKTISDDEAPPMGITIKGNADVIRSIKDLVDLDVKLSGTVAIEGSLAEGIKMNVDGQMEMHQVTELK